jgi:cytochrome c2
MPGLRRLAIASFALFSSACGRESADDAPKSPADRGRAAFGECAICHSRDNPEAPGYAGLVGPSLFGVYGAPSARQQDFNYSAAMREAGLVWDDATLDAFIENPPMVVPKTRMSYAGMSDVQKRADLIVYLKTLK